MMLRLVAASVVLCVVAAAASARQDAAKPDKGEQVFSGACLECHDTRPIDTLALDEAEWTKEVKLMIGKGAEVAADDVPVLVQYLVKAHGPIPDGPGKDTVLNICTQCHDLQRVKRTKLTAEGWAEILEAMLNEGAPITEQDFPVLLRYLSRNFKP